MPSFWVTIKISKRDLGRFLGLVTETFVLPIKFDTKGVKYNLKEYSYAFTNIIFEILDPINTKMVYKYLSLFKVISISDLTIRRHNPKNAHTLSSLENNTEDNVLMKSNLSFITI